MTSLSKVVALDIETEAHGDYEATDWRGCKLRLLGYYLDEKTNGYLTDHVKIKDFLTRMVEAGYKTVFHYGKFDQKVIRRVLGVILDEYFDTHLCATILKERPPVLKLERLAPFFGAAPTSWKEEFREDTASVDDVTLGEYCVLDCKYTKNLYVKQVELIKDDSFSLKFFRRLMRFHNTLTDLEYRGISIDRKLLEEQRTDVLQSVQDKHAELIATYSKYIEEYENELLQKKLNSLSPKTKVTDKMLNRYKTKFKFNFNSTEQLKWLLHKKLGIPCKDKGGKISTRKEVLEQYQHDYPDVKNVLEYRTLVSLLSDYENWDSHSAFDSKIHTSFNLDVARTGRLSSSSPNIQNVKRGEPRKLFVSAPGKKFVVIDYAQIEPRVVAHISKDQKLIDAFHSDKDFYSVLIKGMLNLPTPVEDILHTPYRAIGKTIGLAILYGIGPAKLSKMLTKASGKPYSYTQAMKCIEIFYNNFTGLASLKERTLRYFEKNGRLINMFGRPIYMDYKDLDHKAINAVVQGSASDLNCVACLEYTNSMIRDMDFPARLIHLVHDESIWEVEEGHTDKFLEIAETCMVDNFNLEVPLKIEAKVGTNWGIK